MKSLTVDFVSGLESCGQEELYEFFDSYGHRQPISSINWPDQFPARPDVSFAIVRTNQNIYVDFHVVGNYLRAVNSADLSPVAQDSCVEFFLSPTSDNCYYNFEFNCIGTVNASVRSRRDNPTRLTAEQIASIRRYPSVGTDPFDEIAGVHSWRLIVAIPLSLIGLNDADFPATLTGNFYKCGGRTSEPHYLSWSEINSPAPDFHNPATFGKLLFD